MLEDYLIVHKSVLPDYYEKVVEVRHMLERGEAKDVSAAVRLVGISRSTYYKYKDFLLEPSEINDGRTAVITVMLPHEPGTLSELLRKISEAHASVITITQAVPIRGKAEVTISLDVSELSYSIEELVKNLGARLVAVE